MFRNTLVSFVFVTATIFPSIALAEEGAGIDPCTGKLMMTNPASAGALMGQKAQHDGYAQAQLELGTGERVNNPNNIREDDRRQNGDSAGDIADQGGAAYYGKAAASYGGGAAKAFGEMNIPLGIALTGCAITSAAQSTADLANATTNRTDTEQGVQNEMDDSLTLAAAARAAGQDVQVRYVTTQQQPQPAPADQPDL